MNTILISILYTLAIIGVIAIIALILMLFKGNIYKKAIKLALTNKLHCGQNICPLSIIDLPIPIQTDISYNTSMAKYLANLIIRIENSVKYQSPFQNPKILQKKMNVYSTDKTPVFGMLWINGDVAYIAFRGSIKTEEWIKDFTYSQETFPKYKKMNQNKAMFLSNSDNNPPMVHSGFLKIYNNFREKLLNKLKNLKPKQILVTGHSLGAAVSTICGLDLKILGYNSIVYNFASPRVGDDKLCTLVKTSNLPLYRIVNTCDTVPTLPPSIAPNFQNAEQPYIYTHCGKALYFTDNWKSVLNNHLMGVYIKGI